MKHVSDSATFVLTRTDLRALLVFASRDKCRENLTVVHFNPQDGSASATDGHALVRASNCGTSNGDAYSVRRTDLEKAARLLRKKDDRLRVSRDGDAVRLEAIDGESAVIDESRITLADGQFPSIECLIPSDDPASDPCSVHGFNAELFARVALVQKAAGRDSMHYRFGSNLDPCKVTGQDPVDGTIWEVVIMPIRI